MVAPTPFFADRGCHVRILGEAQALIALGHEVVVCAYPLGRDIPGVPTERTLPIPWYHKLSAGPSVHKFYIDLLLLAKVLLVCRRFRPDIIHAHLHEGIVIGQVASILFRVPLVADLQGSLTGELRDHKFIPGSRWFLRMMRAIEGAINRMPRHLITSSTRTAADCKETFGIPEAKISSVGDGVDLSMFSPQPPDATLRSSLGILPDEKVVVYVGVLTEYQGIDLLIRAIPLVVREFPAVKFLILGYPNVETYRQMAADLGVEASTCFTGKIPYQAVPNYLSLAQVAVSPKISTTEANLKLFTYMAMGLPSVVFDNPVNREILGDLGVYAPPGDVAAYAGALVRILSDFDRAAVIGRRSLEKARQDYSWVAAGKRLLAIYDGASVRNGGRSAGRARGEHGAS
jgi:glycosyltransferase involved in cell wall biosynthesis